MNTSNGSSTQKAKEAGKRVSFALSGRSLGLDHRIHAYRDDVADMALAGKVLAHYYAVPVIKRCILPVANLHEDHTDESAMTSQLLQGEGFAVVDENAGWAWGYCEHDHYVGYLHQDALGETDAPQSLPSIDDPVTVAEELIDTPYLWGGRTAKGIDCSGLMQVAYARAGHSLPRDSDLQLAAIDDDVASDAELQRGDLVFFPNHVGLMTDSTTLIHATQHYGKVVEEALADVIARITKDHDEPVSGRKRILS